MAKDDQTKIVDKTTYPVDDFNRAPLRVPVGYTDVFDATTGLIKSRRGHQSA